MLQRYKQFSRDVEVWVLQRWGRERLAQLRAIGDVLSVIGIIVAALGWIAATFVSAGARWLFIIVLVVGAVIIFIQWLADGSVKTQMNILDNQYPQQDKEKAEVDREMHLSPSLEVYEKLLADLEKSMKDKQ
jgi:hypothetical protein